MKKKLDDVEKEFLQAINQADNKGNNDLARELSVDLANYRRYYKMDEDG